MMVTYFTGKTFNQIVKESVKECSAIEYEPVVDDNQDFYKYIKKNIVGLSGIDQLIIDTSASLNTDEEILDSLEMIRTMYDHVRLIVFAPYRNTGEKFLADCLNMGITNIVNTNDFNDVKKELIYCMKEGMSYRDAVKYKELQTDKIVVKHAVKRAVHKRMIGIAGAEGNIGITHNAIVLANFFRKKGFMVALAEWNISGAYQTICESFEESLFKEGYFTINGIDFYPGVDEERMQLVLEHSYNVIIIDFGCFSEENKGAFERCEDRLIITGSKPWEMDALNKIFSAASKDTLNKYHFCFNFTQKNDYDAIREGMGELDNVYFLKYLEDPFTESDFADGETIFADILPEEEKAEEKKGVFSRLFRKKE